MRLRDGGERGHILHLHGQAARRFEQDRAGLRADCRLECSAIERVEKPRFDTKRA